MVEGLNPLILLIIHQLAMFFYDLIIRLEIRGDIGLSHKLQELIWFKNRSAFKSIKLLFNFKFWGYTRTLNAVGTVVALINYTVFTYWILFIGYSVFLQS